MKKVLLIMMLGLMLSFSYSQCDANGDGDLDVLDVIEEVNCILDDCWENQENYQGILGYWMIDRFNIQSYNDISITFEATVMCGESLGGGNPTSGLYYFDENMEVSLISIDESYCYQNEIDISNLEVQYTEPYQYFGDSVLFSGLERDIIFIDENNLVLRFLIFPGDDSPSPADFQIYTYNYHRVTITND